jgi:hypothetical protein
LRRSSVIVLSLIVLIVLSGSIHSVLAFSPRQGDYFKYSETTDLGNGTGSYSGYTEHQTVTGGENVTGVSGGVVSMNYEYSYDWSNSSGSTISGSNGGPFTFSDDTFHYVNGTDNETSFGGVKYLNPSVWFAMNNLLPVGSNFTMLNTEMRILSTNASVFVPTQSAIVSAIFAQGTGSYERNDVYGEFNAAYIWTAWFDPSTGYIIGYNYVEHDTNSDGDGFTYTDTLYVTQSSYSLTVLTLSSQIGGTTVPISTTSASSASQISLNDYAVFLIVIAIGGTIVFLRKGGRR